MIQLKYTTMRHYGILLTVFPAPLPTLWDSCIGGRTDVKLTLPRGSVEGFMATVRGTS